MSQEEILEKIPELLLVDISVERELTNNQTQDVIDPFAYIEWEENTYLPQELDRSTWSRPIRTLIELVRSGSPLVRGHAAFRLSKLCKIDAIQISLPKTNSTYCKLVGCSSRGLFYSSRFCCRK